MDIKLYILILILPLYVCAVIKYSIYKRKKIKQIINITKITKVDLKKCKKANFIYTKNRKVISFFSYVIYFILFESILNVVITQSKSHVFFSLFFIFLNICLLLALGIEKKTFYLDSIDNYLFEKYGLAKISKQNNFKEIENQKIKLEEEFENKRKKEKWINYKLDSERIKLQKAINSLEKICTSNEYQKIADDGSKISFCIQEIWEKHEKTYYYNIRCKLKKEYGYIKDNTRIKYVEDKYPLLELNVNKKGEGCEINSKYYEGFYKVNKEILVNIVSYSYEACRDIIK